MVRLASHPFIRDGARLVDRPLKFADGTGSAVRKVESWWNATGSKPAWSDAGIEKVLSLLRDHCGVDFSHYKMSTIQRRIARRMVLNKQKTLGDYERWLRDHPQELDALYADVLISVTSFFRNPEAFIVLKQKVFPKLLQQKQNEPFRAWVVGCATGQEAYSIAMAFAEFAQNFSPVPKLQIFATDLQESALEKARAGFYPATLLQGVSPERLRRFFTEESGGYRVKGNLRESVVFARHDLIQDAPFSRMHLIACRNVMIYFEPSLQKKVLPTFHYALKPDGFLFLGASESIGSFTDLFEAVDKKQKIFSRKSTSPPMFQLPVSRRYGAERKDGAPNKGSGAVITLHEAVNAEREADRITINQFAPPGVLVNDNLQIIQFRGATSAFLIPPAGKATFNVLKMAREGLMLPLRALINRARKDNQRARTEGLFIQEDGKNRRLNVEVIPLKNLKERCYLILFKEQKESLPVSVAPTRQRGGKGAIRQTDRGQALADRSAEQARHNLDLQQELSETRDYVQYIQEQYEAANEELQAANEEAQSANEELQSLNEELETSKEELESTNEELTTVNEEVGNRNQELNQLNSDLLNLQRSVYTAIVVLGRDLTIRRFTPLAEEAFNLSVTDIGRPFNCIRANVDFPDFENWIGDVISNVVVREREIRDRKGVWYLMRARPYLTLGNKVDGAVLMMVDIDALKRAEQALQEAHHYSQAIVEQFSPVLVLNKDLCVKTANASFYDHFKVAPAQTIDRMVYELGNGQWNIPELRTLLEDILPRKGVIERFEVRHTFETIGARILVLKARQLDHVQSILLGIEDITERVAAEAQVRASELRYRRLFESSQDGIVILDPETWKITEANSAMAELLGFERDEFIGKGLWAFGLLQDEAARKAAFRQLEQKHVIHYENLSLKTKDGRILQVEFVSNLYRENQRSVIQCNIRDITERKRIEDALKKAKQQIDHHAENLEKEVTHRTAELRDSIKSLESLTYTMAHDLRAPMRAMHGLTNALIEDVPLNEEGKTYADKIKKAADRMDQLINDLLDYGQLTHLDFPVQKVDLEGQVERAINEYTEDLKSVQGEVRLIRPLPRVIGNETLLQQVLGNLLDNALKFVKPGVRPRIVVSAEVLHHAVRVWVEDNGIGIDPQYQDRIFGVFQRLHANEEFPGTGVGLAIIKRAVERMGGKVGLESNVGEGSRFWFELPKT